MRAVRSQLVVVQRINRIIDSVEREQQMNEFLSRAVSPVILIYVVSAMLALGLSQTVRQIFEPLKNVRITVSAIVASYIILPLLAALIPRLFGHDTALRHGLVLMAMAA